MAIAIKAVNRVFNLGDKVLEDPDNTMSPDEVREYYVDAYPELMNGSISTPVISEDGDTITYDLNRSIAQKG